MNDDDEKVPAWLRSQLDRIEGKLDALFAVKAVQSEKALKRVVAIAETMTPKQHAVMQMMVVGMNEREMSDVFGVSRNTVKLHKQAVLHKLDMTGVKEPKAQLSRWFDDLATVGEAEYRRIAGGLSRTWAREWKAGDELPQVLRRTR